MSLLGSVLGILRDRGIAHGLIGGAAMAAHGVVRATLDTDLLVVEAEVLQQDLWSGIGADASIDIRIGDSDDPLVGLVRIRTSEETVDLVVGRGAWQRAILTRTVTVEVGGEEVPIVQLADLVVLKLYAGGPQDLLDIDLLLEGVDESVAKDVESRVADAPRSAQRQWAARIRRDDT